MTTHSTRCALTLGISIVAWGAGACGGGDGGDVGPPPLVLAKAPTESGDQQSGLAGAALDQDLRVVVTRDGVAEAGVTVAWSAGQGSVSPASAVTGSDGISVTTWTLGQTVGAQTAQATVAGATGSPVAFTATANQPPPEPPPQPAPLILAMTPTESGNDQTGPVSAPLSNELRVIVTRDGSPEAGATVVWATGNGAVDPVSVQTGADGIAATSWTLGPAAGMQTATAAVAGATGSPVTFSATAVAVGPPPPPPTSVAVTVGNIFFQSGGNATRNPAVDTVALNGEVTWTWKGTGTTSHSVESIGTPTFASSATLTGNGQSYSVQFTQAGTYTYECAVHGSSMTGRIVVR